jgi:hypothetical protein
MSDMSEKIAACIAREPFEPFLIETTDGRRIVVKERSRAVLNSLAISVVEEAFSVTVIGLGQVRSISPVD